MYPSVRSAALAVTLIVPGSAFAQDVQSQLYFQNVRGWDVYAIVHNGEYGGCMTRPISAADNAPALGRENGTWYLIAPSSQPDGGTMLVDLNIDRASFQENARVQYGLTAIEMDHNVAVAIARGRWLNASYEGYSYDYSLSGSTAAMLKVEECDGRQGQLAGARPAPFTTKKQAPQNIDAIGWVEPGRRVQAPVESDAAYMGLNCPQYGEYQSLGGGAPATLHLTNNADRAANLYWIDFDGHNQEWGSAMPGETIDIQTYDQHSWLLKTFDGECLGGRLIVTGTGDQYLAVQ